MNSTESKHYTESDTATKKSSRWFRIGSHRGEIDQLFDLYWGGPERRITGLTIRIIGVNALALLSLLIGILYLGQYQTRLIEAKLEIFETEVYLMTAAISEGAVKREEVKGSGNNLKILQSESRRIISRLQSTLGKQVLVFDHEGILIADSKIHRPDVEPQPFFSAKKEEDSFESIEILKHMAGSIVSLLPDHNDLPLYTGTSSQYAQDYPDGLAAINRRLSMSVWRNTEDEIVLTAAMPVLDHDDLLGVVMLVNEGHDIREALGDAWFDIIIIFMATLLITVLLSIYLSGLIAKPLRNLARAAENVRKGKLKHTEIPDMSERNDEIGELSIVLRDMTQALWDRMDSIEVFAADVAHEIKNPLTSLKSAVETAGIVKKREDRDKLLSIIQHDVERLDRLISDISSASRLDAELSRESFERVNLTILMKDLIDMFKNPLEREQEEQKGGGYSVVKDGITIKLEMPQDEDIFVMGSSGRLSQVFHNIIANALSFSSVNGFVRITLEVKANRVSIFFDDEGPGIPENHLETIFERFYSERPQHEDYGRHSGLGLSICKQIITAHNGVLYADNNKDRNGKTKGARFVVILNTI